tara:strand:+ start:16557 stop:18209 length:1653 start_codon:yes stop_codon:yes gene_type:complete
MLMADDTIENKSAYSCKDLQQHIIALEEAGLLHRINEAVNKDTELHALVRWQFRGGIAEKDRKAFYFSNVVDSKGRHFDMPVVVGALAANSDIYRIGMDVPLEDIGHAWQEAIANPIPPKEVKNAACQELILEGHDIDGEGKGLDSLPVPISTPGFDSAPYLTAANFITRDPDNGIQNMGTYRGGLKSPTRMVVRMSTRNSGAGGYPHWEKYKERGQKMPCAVVLGCPPKIAYLGPQKMPRDIDELTVAGALAGKPIAVVRCKTIDLMVPADAEIIIEGLIDTEYLEPEAPFGESHGHIALEDYNMIFEVTAITRKKNAVLASIISQVTPSESSVIKKAAYEPMYLGHLQKTLGVKGVKKVSLHEPLTNIRRIIFIVFEPNTPRTEIFRAMQGAAMLRADTGKFVIAISDDINPENADAVFWSLAYRSNPAEDVEILAHRDRGHGPKSKTKTEDSTMLIDATLKGQMPPLALPKQQYMEDARVLWEKLGLPSLNPEAPWHGYSMGDWSEDWDKIAQRAAQGDYLINGLRSAQMKQKNIKPNTPVRSVKND